MKIYPKFTAYAVVSIAQNRVACAMAGQPMPKARTRKRKTKVYTPDTLVTPSTSPWLKLERVKLYLDRESSFELSKAFFVTHPTMRAPTAEELATQFAA